jgi:hypothetical protein
MRTGWGGNQTLHFALADWTFFFIRGRKGLDSFKAMSALFALVFI